jgi:mannosylglycerate hydrolase
MANAGNAQPLELHALTHTHWDREWYHPVGVFRARLVALIDELLDSPPGAPFLLDGQAVLLEDYLEVRPERAAELASALRSSSLAAGPWFVLADELVPAAETLVRNLLAGRRTLARLRAEPPAVLYSPDAFGHPAALPALAAGFGLFCAVIWRGYGGRRWPPGDLVRWRAPDGSEVLLYHLPPSGYEFGADLPSDDVQEVRAHWEKIRSVLVPRATLGVALLTCGADHHAPQRGLREALERLSQVAAAEASLRISSLSDFAVAIRCRAAAKALPTVAGELRDSYGYTWTLQGTLASRSSLKRQLRSVERLLLHDAEPWAALAWFHSGVSSRSLLANAWRNLLLATPHDTIAGTVVDAAARAAAVRLEEAAATGSVVRQRSLENLLGHDREEVRRLGPLEWRHYLVLRNRSARPRSGVAEVTLDVPVGAVAVGPPSGDQHFAVLPDPEVRLGGVVQVLELERAFSLMESPRHYPLTLQVERRRLLLWVEKLPGWGVVSRSVCDLNQPSSLPVEPAAASESTIANGAIEVAVAGGALSLKSRWGTVEDFLGFESVADDGDLYTPAPVEGSRLVATLRQSRVVARGPLRAAMETVWVLRRPARASRTALGKRRRIPAGTVVIRVRIELEAGAPFVRLVIEGDNGASDHRLRCLVRSGLESYREIADAHFGLVERRPLAVEPEDLTMEVPLASAPLQRYVSLAGAQRGITVHGEGVFEYEGVEGGVLALTILRGVGELSRADLRERPGHAAYPRQTPDAQELGPFQLAIAIQPHGGYDPLLQEEIERASDDFLAPLVGETLTTTRALPGTAGGIELRGPGLSGSTIKESESGQWLVLRCFNVREEAMPGVWWVPGVREAWLARLDETPLGLLPVVEEQIFFEAPPRGIVTVLAR